MTVKLPSRIAAVAGVVALAALTACSAGGGTGGPQASACEKSAGKVALEFWSWVPGMDKAVALWNQKNPDIQVKLSTVPNGSKGTYQKMFTSLKAGTAPDLGQVEFDTLPSFRLQSGLRDIGPCGASADKDKFLDWSWRQVTFGENAVYAVPQDSGPMGLFYRKDLFDKYGVAVPKTWQEFADTAAKIHQADPTVYISNFTSGSAWLAALAWQRDARWFALDGDTWKVTVNGPQTREVADYWQQLLSKGLVSTVQTYSDEWNKAVADGKILTWPIAVWAGAVIKTNVPSTAGKWAVAPLPQWSAGEAKSGNVGGSTTAVFKDSKHPYEAAQFARWLNTDPEALTILINEGGIYPAAKEGLKLPVLQQPNEFFGGQKVFDVFAESAQQVDPNFTWGPTMTQTFATVGDALNNAKNGRTPLGEGLDQAQQKTVDAMKQQALKVQ